MPGALLHRNETGLIVCIALSGAVVHGSVTLQILRQYVAVGAAWEVPSARAAVRSVKVHEHSGHVLNPKVAGTIVTFVRQHGGGTTVVTFAVRVGGAPERRLKERLGSNRVGIDARFVGLLERIVGAGERLTA